MTRGPTPASVGRRRVGLPVQWAKRPVHRELRIGRGAYAAATRVDARAQETGVDRMGEDLAPRNGGVGHEGLEVRLGLGQRRVEGDGDGGDEASSVVRGTWCHDGEVLAAQL